MAWGAGSSDLPLGDCLVVEALFVPFLMMVSDGFLMAWLLTELRNAGFDDCGEDRLDLRQAISLMPGSVLACALALPARYVATFVWLGSLYLPTWAYATSLGRGVRWQLGWGLTDLQAVALGVVGLAGAVAWSRGTIRGSLAGYRRVLTAEAGHLVAVLAMAGVAAGCWRRPPTPSCCSCPCRAGFSARPIATPIMSASGRALDARRLDRTGRALAAVRLAAPIGRASHVGPDQ